MANTHETLGSLFTDIADAIRSKTNTTDTIVADEFPTKISSIPAGTDTSDATATASQILKDQTAYIKTGKVTGTMSNNGALSNTITEQGGTFSIPAGYTSGGIVTANIAVGSATTPAATKQQSEPQIDVSDSGLITATVPATSTSVTPTVEPGYIASGTAGSITLSANSKTKQLDTLGATTYTPGTSNQTINKGVYLVGDQTIKGDASLTAGNILKGATIFGVAGTATGDGTATANDILLNKVAYVSGAKITGTIPSPSLSDDDLNLSTYEASTGDYDAKATITIPKGYYEETTFTRTLESIFPKPDSEGTTDKVLSGYTLYDHDGKVIAGTMANNTVGGTITTQGGTYTIPKGYTDGGTVTASLSEKAAETYTPGTTDHTIKAGQYLAGDQTILGDANLAAENIKAGTSIFSISGTYTSDATATAADIAYGKTAYVNGVKITGTAKSYVSDDDTLYLSSGSVSGDTLTV